MVQNRLLSYTTLFCLQIAVTAARYARAEDATATIHLSVRCVEVCVTVKDERGEYISGLSRGSFRVYDDGMERDITTFENFNGDLTCALVLDTTGSMQTSLPAVKNAVMQLIERFRPRDLFGIYSFNSKLRLVQDFTQDKTSAKRAVLQLQPAGATALFDALSQVARGLEEHKGKVAIIVFTDGSDNASTLSIEPTIERMKRLGVPLYAVAQGEALRNRELLAELQALAKATGGVAYAVKRARDVERVFADISQDLQSTYMFTYYAPPAERSAWRSIRVSIPELKNPVIRTKQGYFPR